MKPLLRVQKVLVSTPMVKLILIIFRTAWRFPGVYFKSGEHRLFSRFLAHSLLLTYRSIYIFQLQKVISFHSRTGYECPERVWRYSSTLSLTLALGWGGWSTSCPGQFTPGKRPGTRCTGGCLGPRAGLTGAEDVAPIGIWAWDHLKKRN